MKLYSYMDKNKKKDKYSNLMTKLRKSIESEFYYESIFIVFAVLEDRCESLLKHANISIKNKDNKKLSLSEKLDKIKTNPIFHDEYVKKHLSSDLIEAIYDWKNKRNLLMHELVNTDYENYEIQELAIEGYELLKVLNNKSTSVNKYNDAIVSKK